MATKFLVESYGKFKLTTASHEMYLVLFLNIGANIFKILNADFLSSLCAYHSTNWNSNSDHQVGYWINMAQAHEGLIITERLYLWFKII